MISSKDLFETLKDDGAQWVGKSNLVNFPKQIPFWGKWTKIYTFLIFFLDK